MKCRRTRPTSARGLERSAGVGAPAWRLGPLGWAWLLLLLLLPAGRSFAAPANDNFASAIALFGTAGTTSGTTALATKQPGEPDHAGNAGGHSIWYAWTASSSGPITFFTQGSAFDTLLAAYTGSSVSTLTAVAANDDIPGGLWSGVTIDAVLGTTYYLAIDGYNGANGNVTLSWLQPSVSETILSAAVGNYTGYVIDADAGNSDPGYDRDLIRVDASVRSVNASASAQPTTYRIVVRLLDSANSPQPIFDENGQVSTVFNVTNILAMGGLATVTSSLSAEFRPAARLDRVQAYHVETRVFRFATGGAPFADGANFYTHFTNRISGDLSWNVLGVVVSAPFTRAYAIKTAPGKTAFVIQPFFGIYRYDNFSAPITTDPIPVAFDCVLSNITLGGTVPLKQTRLTVAIPMDSYQAGSPITPRFLAPTVPLELDPQDGVQLDSVNHQFKAYVTLSFTNTPGQPAMVVNSAASPDQRLLHFNGKVFFGDIETQVTAIGNVPPVNTVFAPTRLSSELAVSPNAGFVTGQPGYTYGGGAPLPVDLFVNGDARYTGPGNVPLNVPGGGNDVAAHIRFQRLAAYLNTIGAFADLRVWLPTGFGYRVAGTSSRRVLGTLPFNGARLNQSLQPAADLTFAPGGSFFACEETKPFWIEANNLIWRIGAGAIEIGASGNLQYVRRDELLLLEIAPIPTALQHKPSNEQYARRVTALDLTPAPRVVADAAGNALLNGNVHLDAELNGYQSHFPYGANLRWINTGFLSISNDLVDTAISHLDGMQPVTLAYPRDCDEAGCPPAPTAGSAIIQLQTPATIAFTLDGGLAAAGTVNPAVPLEWGWVSKVSRYAQRSFSYDQAAFHMPGIFLRGDQTAVSGDQRPATLLFTGINATNASQIERYGTSAYQDGFADYAGLNFRVGTDGAKQGESTLAGVGTGAYSLTGRSKYYVRGGGVNGIHEALLGSFPTNLTLYGYAVSFSNYGLSYLDNENKDSRTSGDIRIPYPSQFTQEYEELKFTCLGALDTAKVPASSGDKPLVYWNGKFKPLAIQFETDHCDPTDGVFTLGAATAVAYVPETLFGRLGFLPDGQILNKAHPQGAKYNISSRLKLPNRLTLKGPQSETYEFNTTTEAYFNHAADAPAETGWVNWAGSVDVPFFENIKVHLQTSANTNVASPPIHLMGGWPDHGWGTAVNNFFTDPNGFDLGNRGYDGGSVPNYRNNPAGPQYHPRAQQTWLGVVHFDYPLQWSTSTRSFTSWKPETNKFLVVEISHQVNYLSAQNAELTFGAEYSGVPKLNLANLAFNALSETVGVEAAITNTIGKVAHEVIEAGFDRLTKLLDAELQKFFDPIFAEVLDPSINGLFNILSNAYPSSVAPGWFTSADVQLHVQTYSGNLETQLKDVIGLNTNVAGVLKQVSDSLTDADKALGEVQKFLAKDDVSGNRTISRQLIQNLVGSMAADFIGSFTDPLLNDLLKSVDPTLTQVEKTLTELRGAMAEARSKLDGNFSLELKTEIAAPSAVTELVNAAEAVRTEITNALAQLDTSFAPFHEMTAAQFKTLVRHKIEDRFFATAVSASIQRVFKERLYDLDASIREAVDSEFQQFNGIIRDIIAKSLAEVDKTVNGFLGPIGQAMGHGQINGYAHIKGDSLNLLRVDGQFQWKVPDTMEFKAYLQIKELQSDGKSSCSVPGGKATEVTVGAQDVAVKWISPDLKANISGKFSFETPSFEVLGMGGAFELTGPLTFASFQITELGATMAFGASENYLGAKARLKFNQYELAGAVFFGRTCTLEPLIMVDKDVADVLPPPVLTGAYVYAEGWFPLNEALGIPSSCFFNVRVGIGAGAFFFLAGPDEIPTFGGKMLLGVSGEVLCLISLKGDVVLIGLKSGDELVFKGRGDLSAQIGFCPFCLNFSKSIGMKYQHGWSVDF
jgi:hypothetical protein